MPDSPTLGGPRPATARELRAVLFAEREGEPFFIHRCPDGRLRITKLPDGKRSLTIGRGAAADLSIPWDGRVSGLHAEAQRLAGELTLVDDGLSRNGSYLNGARIRGRRRLRNGDLLRFGASVVQVRIPGDSDRAATSADVESPIEVSFSAQQQKVLLALCRPLLGGESLAAPVTNQQIADELSLSVAAVKLHLRALFQKLRVGDLPHNRKRLTLARLALRTSLFPDGELSAGAETPALAVASAT